MNMLDIGKTIKHYTIEFSIDCNDSVITFNEIVY